VIVERVVTLTKEELDRILAWFGVYDMESQADAKDQELAEKLEKLA
jgi:hypothetical protein